MKRILITGANSYVGTSVESWLLTKKNEYIIETLDMTQSNWIEFSFSSYDIIFHVAGIAHVSTDPKMEQLYYKVNRDLAIDTAKKAKNDGVKQFIFMSSGIVYGENSKYGKFNLITKDTIPNPANFYGKSKLQAEMGIKSLSTPYFKVVILRPPMIYGPGCKGNYNQLSNFGRKLLLFPLINNVRSMLFIDNLSELIHHIIQNEESGTFYPQNNEYVSTTQMVQLIAKAHNRKICVTRLFNPLLWVLSKLINKVNKGFGSFAYDMSLSKYKSNYIMFDTYQSIRISERII